MQHLACAIFVALVIAASGPVPASFLCDPTCYEAAPRTPPCDGDTIGCEGSGSRTALAVNLLRFRLAEAGKAKASGDTPLCQAAAQAAYSDAVAMLVFRDAQKRSGDWRSGVRYQLRQGDVVDEEQVLKSLAEGQKEAEKTFKACGGSALRRTSGAAASLFVPDSAAMTSYGPPTVAQESEAPPERPQKKAACRKVGGECSDGDDCCNNNDDKGPMRCLREHCRKCLPAGARCDSDCGDTGCCSRVHKPKRQRDKKGVWRESAEQYCQ